MLITAVEPRKKSLRAIYLDGELAGLLDAETWELSHYTAGVEISCEEYDRLWEASNYARAKSYALFLLSKHSYSKKGLLEKVKRQTIESAAVQAVERMEELGLIDDIDYARRYAKDLLELKHYSTSRALYELVQKGVDKETAQRALEEQEPDPEEQIRTLVEKKYYRFLDDEKGFRRTVAALQRLGYRWEHIKKVLGEFTGREDPGFDG